jgi:hypothetical protein
MPCRDNCPSAARQAAMGWMSSGTTRRQDNAARTAPHRRTFRTSFDDGAARAGDAVRLLRSPTGVSVLGKSKEGAVADFVPEGIMVPNGLTVPEGRIVREGMMVPGRLRRPDPVKAELEGVRCRVIRGDDAHQSRPSIVPIRYHEGDLRVGPGRCGGEGVTELH